MKKINLSKIEHHGVFRIKVAFKQDANFISKIKTIHGRRWSKTKNCWHLPYSKESFEQLKIVFGEERLVFPKKIKVDDIEKKKTIVASPKENMETSPPLHSIKSRDVFNKKFTIVNEDTPFSVGDFLKKKENAPEKFIKNRSGKILFKTVEQYGKMVRVVVGKKIILEKENEKWLRVFIPFDKKRWREIVKNIGGRKWKKEEVCWLVPFAKENIDHMKKYIGMEYLVFAFAVDANISK